MKPGGQLFEAVEEPEGAARLAEKPEEEKAKARAARVVLPNRKQVELRPMDLESLLPAGHRARLVWGWIERQDLSGMYAKIKAREGGKGRSKIAPEILFGLWLYATLEGEGSAREIARLVMTHDAYRWISGAVQVNYHSLSDFRTEHGGVLDDMLSASVAALMSAGAVKLKRVAQDGMRVRASAGAASFRRRGTLEDCLKQATERVQALKEQIDKDPGQASRRTQAAQERAQREIEERVKKALERLPELERAKVRGGGKAEEARASTTDADASVMKMADGGFRPAFNTQFATDCETQVIIGVDVVTAGSDMAQLVPMVEQVEQRCGQVPEQWLVDGGYVAHQQIEAVADKTEVYGPVPELPTRKDKQNKQDAQRHQIEPSNQTEQVPQDKYAAKSSDSAQVASWRARMGQPEAQTIYRDRAATAECVNALARNRGLVRMPVRGLPKVRCVALLYALAHNLMRAVSLTPEMFGLGIGASAISQGAT